MIFINCFLSIAKVEEAICDSNVMIKYEEGLKSLAISQ